MMISGLMLESSGLGCLRIPKLPISNHRFNGTRFIGSNSVRIAAGRISGTWIRHFLGRHTLIKCATSSGRSYQEPSFDDYRPEPYWLTLTKEAYWALKSLFVFLAEQPGQLRYIEWPSFQGTPFAISWLCCCGNLHEPLI
ncbi:PREDICTED: uncharacterized protein LOC104607241 isoform X2 [Nelumbo nucifera]|uniref:Uncharacterized protein LOC104607241 isoform X2 n=1 Tax=Nelumbo nucifera TaxID=4432 RepID=A0A1U8AWU8_NELNU|nr:PREDICTED: uncharacterized protein LOC104607241 isoform X2 [Nelumbo nucifera]